MRMVDMLAGYITAAAMVAFLLSLHGSGPASPWLQCSNSGTGANVQNSRAFVAA